MYVLVRHGVLLLVVSVCDQFRACGAEDGDEVLSDEGAGWDDYFMIVAWLIFIPYTVFGFMTAQYGTGAHQYNISFTSAFDALKVPPPAPPPPPFSSPAHRGQTNSPPQWSYIMIVSYIPLILTLKISILLQLQRIFCPQNIGIISLVVRIMIPFHALIYAVALGMSIGLYNPVEKFWHPYLEGKCTDKIVAYTIHAACSVPSDFAILVIPIVKIWGLQFVTGGRKVALTGIFAAGLLACVCSIMRLYYTTRLFNNQDYTYAMATVSMWSVAEIASGMTCACLPSIPPLIKHFAPKVKGLYGTLTTKRQTAPDSFVKLEGAHSSQDKIYKDVQLDVRSLYVKGDDRSSSSV
ncbi:hypothetical protein CC80DRAFT_543552 [Byssothecium circinans]|uniref:Rhodopsin domain-containing protein n=1 Tax=Byssothecium circinans TaxID=147558 RepID=A0A6A5U946_9PLEO|nr:hypothetical protein CC80DRAFT_543552 [Byssothecium circinans]